MKREEAIKIFQLMKKILSIPNSDAARTIEAIDMAIEALSVANLKEEFESADAVYGMWLPIEETLPTYDGGEKIWITGMKCSNCGKMFDLRVGYYFCPSCGARMKGGAE